jgi:hypothetical protein
MSFLKSFSDALIYYQDENCAIIHRDDGPAIEWFNGTKEWIVNGELHRDNGPAIVYDNGSEQWFCRGLKHRLGGPAVSGPGYKEWRYYGQLHRNDGPATQCATFGDAYYLHGLYLTPEEWSKFTGHKLCKFCSTFCRQQCFNK